MADWGHYIARDSYFSIAQGQFDGYSSVHVTGYNSDVDTASDETVWNAGGLYPWSVWNSTRLITVVSNSASGSVVDTPQSVVVNVNSSDVVSRLESLIAVMQTGNINTQTTAVNTGKINKLFERVSQDGDSIRTTAV